MKTFALSRLIGLRNDAYVVSAWVVVTLACYFAAVMPAILAIPAALIAIQVPIYLTGGIVLRLAGRNGDNQRVNAAVFMALMIIVSVIVASSALWQRWVADVFLAIMIANFVAAGIERCDD